jgi:hypothetical protein
MKNNGQWEWFDAGARHERERIIALIQSKDEWHYEFSDASDVVALIREK